MIVYAVESDGGIGRRGDVARGDSSDVPRDEGRLGKHQRRDDEHRFDASFAAGKRRMDPTDRRRRRWRTVEITVEIVRSLEMIVRHHADRNDKLF